MPLPQGIANPGGALGLPLAGTNIGGQVVMTNDGYFIEMVNNSGANRQYGDVVIADTGSAGGLNGLNANTTTTGNDYNVIGVVAQQNNPPTAIPSGAVMLVQIRGVARVNIGANTVLAGQHLATFTTAGQAQAVANATAVTTTNANGTAGNYGSIFALALEANGAKDTNNTIRCKLIGGI